MNNWNELYSKTLEQISKEDIRNKKTIVGFNVNVDKIIEIRPESFNKILLEGINLELKDGKIELPTRVNSIEDFFSFLVFSIMEGKALEIVFSSEAIANWIENNFEIKNDQIGGQAGIIANLFKSIEVSDVLLSMPTFDPQLANLLDPSLLTIVEEDNSYSIQEISKLEFKDKEPLSHYIFEFKKGNYEFKSMKFNCSRDNRFIFTYDEINTLVKFNRGFHEFSPNFVSSYSLAILSGFCLANEKLGSFEEIFHPAIKMIKKWKQINPDLFIHVELSSSFNAKKRNHIKENIFPLVNSIGVNEQEILLFSSIDEDHKELKLDQKNTSISFFQLLHKLFSQYPHLRIHLHYLGYFLVISPVMEKKEAERARTALIMSSIFTASKAKEGTIESFEDIYELDLNLSSRGFEELKKLNTYLESKYDVIGSLHDTGIVETSSFSLIGIPTILVKNPQKLVGLGDTISSIAVLFDTND